MIQFLYILALPMARILRQHLLYELLRAVAATSPSRHWAPQVRRKVVVQQNPKERFGWWLLKKTIVMNPMVEISEQK